jgi:hypothetical protein
VTVLDVDVALPVRSEDQVPLDQYGRYLIVPQGGAKAKPHTRVTTVSGTLDDRYALERWGHRMVALGLVARRDLYARLAATRLDDKGSLDHICDKAKEAAAASSGANLGTALHEMTARHDLGEEFEIPPPWDADVKAYRQTLALHDVEILPEYVERYVVLSELGIAGKFDRLAGFGSLPKIADLKTGVSLDLSWGNIAIQLAHYAHGDTLYDAQTRTHVPMPEVDHDVALVIHLPAGQARCSLWWVDIAAGWEAATHARWAREWRKRKDLAEPWTEGTPVTVPDVRRARLVERLTVLGGIPGALEHMARTWPAGIPTFKAAPTHTPDELDTIALAMSVVEAEVGAPFGPLDPANAVDLKRKR